MPDYGVPTNYPGGVNNVDQYSALGSYIAPDPSAAHTFFDDFNSFTATNWTVTETQGSATQAVITGDGGLLALRNTNSVNDVNGVQWANLVFAPETTKQLWGKARFKLSDATNQAILIGLTSTIGTATSTAAVQATDGMFFWKPSGSTNLRFVVVNGSTATTTTGVATLANDTFATVAWAYDGLSTISIFAADSLVANSVATNLPTTNLSPNICTLAGTAAVSTMTVDYIFAGKQRTSEVTA